MKTPAAIASRNNRIALALIVLLCVACTVLQWRRVDSILTGNVSKWLGEALRASRGQVPYRDFSWPYPPLGLWATAAWIRAFGPTFAAVNGWMALLSTACVLLFYRVAKIAAGVPLAFLLALSVLLVYGFEGNVAPLFSLRLYSPAILTGTLGLLLLLAAALRWMQGARSVFGIVCGSLIALLSKPEFAAAALLLLLLLFWLSPRRRITTTVVTAACLPAALVYALLLVVLGSGNVLTCLSGLGLTRLVCPLWPTGLGAFSILVALTSSVLLLAPVCVLCVIYARRNPGIDVPRAAIWFVFAIPALARYLPWYFASSRDANPNIYLTWFLNTSSLLTAVVWPLAAVLLWLVFRRIRGALDADEAFLLLLCAPPVAMQLRSAFATILAAPRPVTETPVAACLVAILGGAIVAAHLLARRFAVWLLRTEVETITGVTVLLFALAVSAGSWYTHRREPPYTAVETPAGKVRVRDAKNTGALLTAVLEQTGPSDPILEIPMGGGLGFATRRLSPAYTTQFTSVAPPQWVLDRDLAQVRAHPPKLVIGRDEPQLGAFYGMNAVVGCTFPQLVWQPTRLAGDPSFEFPVIRYLGERYRIAARHGPWLVLEPSLLEPFRDRR